jgi:hypothetical protein
LIGDRAKLAIFIFTTHPVMTIHFGYDKKQVIQALRYHFLNRLEIRILLILVNLFAIASAVLLYFKKIYPLSFIVFSILWFLLMLIIWRILPISIYRRSATFRDHFTLRFEENELVLETRRGAKGWPWKVFSHFVETPYFFHLYFDPRSFFLVPKDSFKDITQVQQARQMFREKIGR